MWGGGSKKPSSGLDERRPRNIVTSSVRKLAFSSTQMGLTVKKGGRSTNIDEKKREHTPGERKGPVLKFQRENEHNLKEEKGVDNCKSE